MGNETNKPKGATVRKFYFGTEQNLRDAGSLSTFTPLGAKTNVNNKYFSGTGTTFTPGYAKVKGDQISGVHVVDYEFVPGLSTDGASPINIASRELYSFVRHANSGSRNYDAPDLTNYAYVVTTLYAYIAQLQRCYGAMMKYSGKNRFFGKALVNALGFDYDDLDNKLSDFRTYINLTSEKVNALKVPAAWPAATRQFIMNSIVVKDGDIDKSQLLIFRLKYLWLYNETGAYVGSLTPYQALPTPGGTPYTLADIKTKIDNVINSIVVSEDTNIMSGDILKAYGEDVLKLSPIAEDYRIEPIYDKSLLSYYHNLSWFQFDASYTTTDGNIIYQDTTNNCLIFNPKVILTQANYGLALCNNIGTYCTHDYELDYLDFNTDKVEPYDCVNGMAGKNMVANFNNWNSGSVTTRYASFGTELIEGVYVFYDPSAGNTLTVLASNREMLGSETGYWDYTNAYPTLNQLSKHLFFDWAPILYKACYMDDKGDPKIQSAIFGDMYNFTPITKEDLKKAHEVIVLSSFGMN